MDVHYLDSSLKEFIVMLEKATIAKVLRAIDLLERFGHELGMPHSKKVEQRIFELRIRGGQEVRILYTLHGGTAVLLHGFVKKSQRIPARDLATAHKKLRALDGV